MDVWVETAAGNLVKGSSITHIVVRYDDNERTWFVAVSASAAPAEFATGLTDQLAARSIRNRLALTLSTAQMDPIMQIVSFEDGRITAASPELAA